jgi:DNA-directed RNA polymerase delta subunit
MKTLSIEDHTYGRLTSVMQDIMQGKKRNMTYDDVINELIDVFQDNSWINTGASSGGG